MQMQGKALCVTIYIGEKNRHQGKPLYVALLEFLRHEGAMGATVTRGLAGFGARSRIRTASIIELSSDLPIKLEWIDHPEQVDRLMPRIRTMVGDGLITVSELEVIQYAAGRRPDPLAQRVGNIMRTSPTTVAPDTPAAKIVTLLIDRGYRCLPVVDGDYRVVGIITDGDLLRQANLAARLGLYGTIPADVLRNQFVELTSSATVAADIMAEPVVTIDANDTLRNLVTKMNLHDLKRLPVVDSNGQLIGLVTRLDLLRTLEYQGLSEGSAQQKRPREGSSIAELMNVAPPTVRPEASLEEVMSALELSHQQRVMVIDSWRNLVGIVTDGDILRRSQDRENPSLLIRLRGLVTGEPPIGEGRLTGDETAADLMTVPVFTISAQAPLDEALRLMLRHKIKRLPVIDEEKHLVGLLGRTSLLNGLVGQSGIETK